MKTLNNIVSTLLVLILIAGLVAGSYYTLVYVIDLCKGLDEQVTNIIYAVLVVGLFSMMVISMIGRRVQARAKRNQLFMQKVETYKRFIKALSSMLTLDKKQATTDEHLFTDDIQNAERELMLFASNDVLKRYVELQNHDDPEDIMKLIDYLIFEIRKHLGNSNTGLNNGELAGLLMDFTETPEQSGVSSLSTAGMEV